MDYKGYNIAVHEFGHNVEQTLDLYDIDYYMLNGVPNTAFTETLAFIFQKRDLQLLGYNTNKNANAAGPANAAGLANSAGPANEIDPKTALDIFWGAYEIMGVSLVDMYSWIQ